MSSKSSEIIVGVPSRVTSSGVSQTSVDRITFARGFTGVSLPRYKQVIKDKGDATTPFTAFDEILVDSMQSPFAGIDTTSSFPNVSSDRFGFQAFRPTQKCPDSDVQAAVAKATSRAYSKISDLTSPFQGQIFLGELKETLELLKNPLHKSIQLTESFLKIRNKDRKRFGVSKAVGESWLEYRFGILPFIADMKGLLALAEMQASKDEVLSYRFYGESSSSASSVLSGRSDIYGFEADISVEETYKAQCIINLGFNQSMLNQPSSFSARLEANLLNPGSLLETAWEIFPFSFLVDYFVNVGNIISASVASTRGITYTSRSVIRTSDFRWSAKYVDAYAGRSIISPGSRIWHVRRRDVERVPQPLGIPPVVFGLPHSDIRLANIAALLTNLL